MIVDKTIFSEMINSPVRQLRGRVEVFEGSTLALICGCHDKLKSFTVERVGEQGKFFGFGICQKLNVHLLDPKRELNITTANNLEVEFGVGSDYIYPYPKFYVTEVNRDEETNELSITAYDALYAAAAHTVAEVGLQAPYTIGQFAAACADAISGLTLKVIGVTDGSFDTSYATGANFDVTETLREVLDAIAEATQTIYYIDKDENLVFKRLDVDSEPVLNIDKETYFTFSSKTNRRLSAITHTTELGDNVTASTGVTGSTQFVRDNPFWELRDDIAELVDNAMAAMNGITINQFDCSWRGNFLLEIGDKIGLVTKDDKTTVSYVLDDTINFNGSLSGKTQWSYIENETETASNPTSLGDAIKQTYARVDKANRQIDLVASETSANTTAIGSLQLSTESISSTVSKVQKDTEDALGDLNDTVDGLNDTVSGLGGSVEELSTQITQTAEELALTASAASANTSAISALQINTESISSSVFKVQKDTEDAIKELDEDIEELSTLITQTAEDVKVTVKKEIQQEGVSSVTTETGFTFNEEGLSVSKSNSNITTQITEDGMTVSRNDEAVLTADNTGVKAMNLHATTYLFVGVNSRFQDYDNNTRTGCFWVGK